MPTDHSSPDHHDPRRDGRGWYPGVLIVLAAVAAGVVAGPLILGLLSALFGVTMSLLGVLITMVVMLLPAAILIGIGYVLGTRSGKSKSGGSD